MPSLLLLILLLSVSTSASDGRLLIVHDKDSHRAFHHSSKDATIVRHDNKASAPLNQTSLEEEFRSSASMEGPKGLEAPMKEVGTKRDAISGAVRIPSLVNVSWRVPRQGSRENPGFNVDYMGPRTHPPSHN